MVRRTDQSRFAKIGASGKKRVESLEVGVVLVVIAAGNVRFETVAYAWARDIDSSIWLNEGFALNSAFRVQLEGIYIHDAVWPVPGGGGQVIVRLRRNDELLVQVIDDGAGLPDGFDLDRSTGLGLSIVRTLVTSELGGSIRLWSGEATTDRPGTVAEVRIPLRGEPE